MKEQNKLKWYYVSYIYYDGEYRDVREGIFHGVDENSVINGLGKGVVVETIYETDELSMV